MPKKMAIKGTIIPTDYQRIYDAYNITATSPGMVETFLSEANGEDVELEVNSPGGYVFAGFEIYNRLKMYPGKVTATIIGVAASAASLVICAADTVRMSPVSQLMIHRAHSWTEGDANDMYKTADDLKKLDESVANAYMIKTGMSHDEVIQIMDVTTWLGAEEAKNRKFVDEILFQQEEQPAAAVDVTIMFTQSQISALREALQAKETVEKQQKTAALDLLRQKHNYLILKNGGTK